MAKLMLVGEAAQIELKLDDETSEVIATCSQHRVFGVLAAEGCSWTERYDTLHDAAEYAADHADRG